MHPKVLSTEAWQVLKSLKKDALLDDWTLAGGTGLALQLGHRLSEDLDFFFPGPFDSHSLLKKLALRGAVSVHGRATSTLHVGFQGVKLTFLSLEAPLLFRGINYRGLSIADPRDIAVMKIVAIGGRGARKDFVDLFFCLESIGSLSPILSLLRQRFKNKGIDYNEYHLMKSLIYFADAETEPMPRMLKKASWDDIKNRIVTEVRRLGP